MSPKTSLMTTDIRRGKGVGERDKYSVGVGTLNPSVRLGLGTEVTIGEVRTLSREKFHEDKCQGPHCRIRGRSHTKASPKWGLECR